MTKRAETAVVPVICQLERLIELFISESGVISLLLLLLPWDSVLYVTIQTDKPIVLCINQ